MKTKKRSKILSILLALSMLVGMVPFSVIPASAAEEGDWTEVGTYEELYDAFRTGKSKIRLNSVQANPRSG